MLLVRASTKRKSPYDPDPYKVIEVEGTQIKAVRGKFTKTRDVQRWKIFRPEKKVWFKIPKTKPDANWELEVEAPPDPNQPPQPPQGGRRRRIRENWIVRAPRKVAPPRLPRELRNLAPYMRGGTSTSEDPAQFRGTLPSRRSARTRTRN